MLMAEKLTPKDIAKYKEKSKRAINGLNIAIQKASEIAQTPKIGEKWKYIADCMGLKQEEGNSYYNTYISLNSNVFFLLRNANHNNTIPELYNKREKNGRPNKRFVVFFQRDNKFGDAVSDFLESEHHTITYPPNALDTENDVIAYCKAYISLFQNGSTTFPKLPSIQENNRKTQYKMKQRIRLTEKGLHRIVRKCINEALNESGHLFWRDEDGVPHTNSRETWHGVKGTVFIDHGCWADPEVWYDGEEINGSFLEDSAWNFYQIECKEDDKEPTEEEYDNLPASWFQDYLDYDFMPAFKGV